MLTAASRHRHWQQLLAKGWRKAAVLGAIAHFLQLSDMRRFSRGIEWHSTGHV
jgi:hypothetical protein